MSAPSLLRSKCDIRHWSHQHHKAGEFFIAGEDCNLAFTDVELDTVVEMWREGRAVADIIKTLKRPGIEIGFLIMDLAEKNIIEDRPGGVWGHQNKGGIT